MAGVENRTWQGPPHFVVKEISRKKKRPLLDYAEETIRCRPRVVVVHRREGALVESDGGPTLETWRSRGLLSRH